MQSNPETRFDHSHRSHKRPQHPHPQGGQHRSPAGTTTFDSLSDREWVEDMKRRLDDFLAEQERCRGEHVS